MAPGVPLLAEWVPSRNRWPGVASSPGIFRLHAPPQPCCAAPPAPLGGAGVRQALALRRASRAPCLEISSCAHALIRWQLQALSSRPSYRHRYRQPARRQRDPALQRGLRPRRHGVRQPVARRLPSPGQAHAGALRRPASPRVHGSACLPASQVVAPRSPSPWGIAHPLEAAWKRDPRRHARDRRSSTPSPWPAPCAERAALNLARSARACGHRAGRPFSCCWVAAVSSGCARWLSRSPPSCVSCEALGCGAPLWARWALSLLRGVPWGVGRMMLGRVLRSSVLGSSASRRGVVL